MSEIHPQEKHPYEKAFEIEGEEFYFFSKDGPHYYLPLSRKIQVDALTIAGELRVDNETLIKFLTVILERLTDAVNGLLIGQNIADSRTLVNEILKRMVGLPSIDVIYRFAACYLFKLEDDFGDELPAGELMRRIGLFQRNKKKVFFCPIIRDLFKGKARTETASLLSLIHQMEVTQIIYNWQESTLLPMIEGGQSKSIYGKAS